MNKYEEQWVNYDTLKSLEYDLYFSVGRRYYCAANCEVCYIKDQLDIVHNTTGVYPPISSKIIKLWDSVFDYFSVIRTDDDIYYYKKEYPEAYNWFKDNASKLEYCITDNAIIRYHRIIDEVQFKSMGSITISSTFVDKINTNKLLKILNKIQSISPIKHFKLINTTSEKSKNLQPFADFAKKLNIDIIAHHDFRDERAQVLDEWATEQSDWISTKDGEVVHLYANSRGSTTAPHFYYDRFYFSNDAASDFGVKPFHIIKNEFNPEQFCYDLIKGKQEIYKKWVKLDFTDYINTTLNYKVNYPFNFIPGVMLPSYSKFCAKLIDRGWIRVPQGLYKEGDTIVSIMEKK